MIGNDIVDLQLAAKESNWNRQRFLDKVFTSSEQSLIQQSIDSDQMVWRLWSMKESVYKAYVREKKHVFFNPLKLSCTLCTNEIGIVEVFEQVYRTKTISNPKFIYTSIQDQNKNVTNWVEIYPTEKYSIHSDIEIKKDALNIPILFMNKRKLPYQISISHHGNYIAYSVAKS